MSMFENFYNFQPHDTLSYPKGFIDDLNEVKLFKRDAFGWLAGQFLKNILNFNEKTKQFIKESIDDLKITKPYFG